MGTRSLRLHRSAAPQHVAADRTCPAGMLKRPGTSGTIGGFRTAAQPFACARSDQPRNMAGRFGAAP